MSILDQGHNQKLSKIETLRLAQNYIQLLTMFLATNQRVKFDDMHHMLTRNLSQATGNLLRARLPYDMDYTIAQRIIIDGGEEEEVGGSNDDYFERNGCHGCTKPYWTLRDEEERGYSDYVEVDPFYVGCCYK